MSSAELTPEQLKQVLTRVRSMTDYLNRFMRRAEDVWSKTDPLRVAGDDARNAIARLNQQLQHLADGKLLSAAAKQLAPQSVAKVE